MDEVTARISFKVGGLEVDCEGREEFLKDGLVNLMAELIELCKENYEILSTLSPEELIIDRSAPIEPQNQRNMIEDSTNTIATKMDVKTEPELVIAAATHLTLVLKKQTFTRADILSQMKSAKTYYKKSYGGGNLTQALNGLVKNNHLNLVSDGTYALSANELKRVEGKLA